MQYDGIKMPQPGDPHSENINSAAWLQSLVRAATGRSQNLLPQDDSQRGLEVEWSLATVKQGSVIGARGATYPGSPTEEPRPYFKGDLNRSDLLLYVKDSYSSANTVIEGFPFTVGTPVRVLVDYDPEDVYQTGMPVGRLAGSTKIKAGGGGLILVTLPYTPDDGDNYYSYVILDHGKTWVGILDEALPAATNSKTGATHKKATLCYWKMDTEEYIETDPAVQIPVWNHSESNEGELDTFGKIKYIDNHFWFFGDCGAMEDREGA